MIDVFVITFVDFSSLFISSVLVSVFGRFYVGIYITVKVKMLKQWFIVLAYMFWLLIAYCLYLMGNLMHIGEFTVKALVVTAIGLLLLPHAVYCMQNQVHKKMSFENIHIE